MKRKGRGCSGNEKRRAVRSGSIEDCERQRVKNMEDGAQQTTKTETNLTSTGFEGERQGCHL